MTTPLLRRLAHKALSQTRSPETRGHPDSRHLFRNGIAFNAQNPPGPSFNYVAVLGVTLPLDEVIKQADAFFAGKEGGYGILVEGDIGHPLETELRAGGLKEFHDQPTLIITNLRPDAVQKPHLHPAQLTLAPRPPQTHLHHSP